MTVGPSAFLPGESLLAGLLQKAPMDLPGPYSIFAPSLVPFLDLASWVGDLLGGYAWS
jgi:hypothetical protein